MNEFCAKKRKSRENLALRTPQLICVAERKTRTLIEDARKTIYQKGIGPDWMLIWDLLTPSMNYIPVRKENYADSKEQGITCADAEDLDDQQFIKQRSDRKLNGSLETREILNRGTIIKNKARLVAQGYRQEEDGCQSAFLYANHREEVMSNRLRRWGIDKTLFIRRIEEDIMLYRYLLMISSLDLQVPQWSKDFEDLIAKEFKMSSMGELTFLFGLQNIKPASTPMKAHHKSLGKDEAGDDVDVLFIRFFGLVTMMGQSDRRSSSGGCQYTLARRLVYWHARNNSIVAFSSTRREYASSCKLFVLRYSRFEITSFEIVMSKGSLCAVKVNTDGTM
ncbi:hypothetical protein Tco_1493191 [Tanacetum coccineum]